MSKISNDGAEQLQIARKALDSIYNKLEVFISIIISEKSITLET